MTLSIVDILLISLFSSVFILILILVIFLLLPSRSKLIKNALIEISGVNKYLQNFRSIYVRLKDQKENIKDVINNSIAKSSDEVTVNLENVYLDLDQTVLDYVREIEKFEKDLESSKKG